jgi:hypothetical protein
VTILVYVYANPASGLQSRRLAKHEQSTCLRRDDDSANNSKLQTCQTIPPTTVHARLNIEKQSTEISGEMNRHFPQEQSYLPLYAISPRNLEDAKSKYTTRRRIRRRRTTTTTTTTSRPILRLGPTLNTLPVFPSPHD